MGPCSLHLSLSQQARCPFAPPSASEHAAPPGLPPPAAVLNSWATDLGVELLDLERMEMGA
jgi:hypothetical protein